MQERSNVQEQRKAITLLQNVQRVLEPINVRNPYAEQLKIPKEVFKQRRTNAHYLAFIEVISFYKQFNGEQKVDETTGKIFIETTLEDTQEANKLMKEILLRKSDELNGATRNYFEELKKHLQQTKQSHFTNTCNGSTSFTKHTPYKKFIAMKILLLQSEAYRYIVQSLREWLQILGYSEQAFYQLPNYVQEFNLITTLC